VSQELEHSKQVFFSLINKAQEKIDQLEAQAKFVYKYDDCHFELLAIEYELISDLIKIYKELVNHYVVELALFEWPKLAKNNQETLSKLYMITFTKLQEIQEKLCQIIRPDIYRLDNDNDKAIDMLHSIMFGSFRCKPIPTFEHKLATFEKEFLQHY
jgi:hypothetical protein